MNQPKRTYLQREQTKRKTIIIYNKYKNKLLHFLG